MIWDTDLSYLYGGHEIRRSRDFDTMHSAQDFAQVLRHCDFDFRPIMSIVTV
jgi:hypothetical protein